MTRTKAPVERKLPGSPRLREEALREYEEYNAARRQRIVEKWGDNAVSHFLFECYAPDAREQYRWRVKLSCGCIQELLIRGEEKSPLDGQWAHGDDALPAGQIYCHHDGDSEPTPYRQIIEWRKRIEKTFPPDPEEKPDYVATKREWAKIRRTEAHTAAFWAVTLDCGHATEVCTDLDFTPEVGPRRVDDLRRKKMIRDFARLAAKEPDNPYVAHSLRMAEDGWPMPQTEHWCFTCPHARQIVGVQRVGWLVPPTPALQPPKPPSRESIEKRLKQAERDAERLRAQLAEMPADD